MRWTYCLAMASGLLLAAVALHTAGCSHDTADCGLLLCSDGSAGTGGDDAGGDAGAEGGEVGMNCDPATLDGPGLSACGVFVASNFMGQSDDDTNNDGSPSKPFRTFAAAISAVMGKPPGLRNVYACGSFTAGIELTAGITLYGGFECNPNDWFYSPTANTTALTADPDAVPLKVSGTSDVHVSIHDFAIKGADAAVPGGSSIAVMVDGATATFTRCRVNAGDGAEPAMMPTGSEVVPGGSSIAVVVANGATATFANCELHAGNGQDGLPGAPGGDQEARAQAGTDGAKADVKLTPQSGGSGGMNMCDGTLLSGGNGGDGGGISMGTGGNGTPGDNGSGGPPGFSTSLADHVCSDLKGMDGVAMPAAAGGLGVGVIDANGYRGADGQTGVTGANGTSGGGGGGSQASTTLHGAGGGGGGAGGCGGKHGTGGTSGGSSITLLSVDAVVTMTNCTLTVGNGGLGGAGGNGQLGQMGGNGGIGGSGVTNVIADGCNGGSGGNGGDGAPGGGGQGGHSLGIAMTGTTPVLDDATKSAITLGMGGTGGNGGLVGTRNIGHFGDNGMAAVCWNFGMSDGACW